MGNDIWLSGDSDDRIDGHDQLCHPAAQGWSQTDVLVPATPSRTPPSIARWSSGPPEEEASPERPESQLLLPNTYRDRHRPTGHAPPVRWRGTAHTLRTPIAQPFLLRQRRSTDRLSGVWACAAG